MPTHKTKDPRSRLRLRIVILWEFFPLWKLQSPLPTVSSPRIPVFPSPCSSHSLFRGGQLYLEPPNNDSNSLLVLMHLRGEPLTSTEAAAGTRACHRWDSSSEISVQREERVPSKQCFGEATEGEIPTLNIYNWLQLLQFPTPTNSH